MSNSLRKKTVVVGSGIAGITAAYFEAKKGNNVVLIEAEPEPGGLLKSEYNGVNFFDYGTHIFSETNISELNDFLLNGFDEKNCIINKKILSGNYFNGLMNKRNSFVDSSTLPRADFRKGCLELLSSEGYNLSNNLEDYIVRKMGFTFYNKIFKNVINKYMGVNASTLDVQVGSFFDMSRILAFDEVATNRLLEIAPYDSILGHHTRQDGIRKYYPKNGGIGEIIKSLMSKLTYIGVELKFSTKICSILDMDGTINSIMTDDGEVIVDKLVWTLPSSFLIGLSGGNKKTTPPKFRNTGLYDFTFKLPLNSNLVYINVYDTSLLSGRITLYQNLSQSDNYSCTVEVLADDEVTLENKLRDIHLELIKMKLVDSSNECLYENFRPVKTGFPILTKEYIEKQRVINNFCSEYFSNVLFVGRSTNSVFFMNDVLEDTYKNIMKC